MGRFINLGIAIVNISYIIRVEMESDGRAEIYMSDGTMFRCDHFDASQLYGTNEKKEGATSLHLQEELRYDQSHSMYTWWSSNLHESTIPLLPAVPVH